MVLQNIRMPPEQIREITMEWLMPLTEDGTMDDVFKEFVTQLTPFVAAAARRAIREKLSPHPEVLLVNVRNFFTRLLETFEALTLNPDMMAASHSSWQELTLAMVELRNWIDFLDRRCAPSEVIVQPTADAMMSSGGVP